MSDTRNKFSPEFRERAVDAATRLFARHGYEAVTMRAVAGELGCSPMTPYRYFASKDDLLAAVRTKAFGRFADAQAVALESECEPLAQLLALRRAYVAFALAEPDAYRIMFELSQEPVGEYPDLQAEVGRSFSYLHLATAAAIDSGVMSGEALTTAHQLWASVHGAVALHLAGKLTFGRTLAELIDEDISQHADQQRGQP